ncbi:hypothetical protein ACFX2C_022127 [Malus domestica]
MAILDGCMLAKNLELDKIVMESDSKEMCHWSWVPKSANMVADRLASSKNSEMSDYTWVERPSSSIVHILNKDSLPCPP